MNTHDASRKRNRLIIRPRLHHVTLETEVPHIQIGGQPSTSCCPSYLDSAIWSDTLRKNNSACWAGLEIQQERRTSWIICSDHDVLGGSVCSLGKHGRDKKTACRSSRGSSECWDFYVQKKNGDQKWKFTLFKALVQGALTSAGEMVCSSVSDIKNSGAICHSRRPRLKFFLEMRVHECVQLPAIYQTTRNAVCQSASGGRSYRSLVQQPSIPHVHGPATPTETRCSGS